MTDDDHRNETIEDILCRHLDQADLPAPGGESPEPVPAYLAGIDVTGLRGIGPTATLNLVPGPGLTIVTGRNGCGKSSFAEAVEFAITGDNRRWSGRSAVWRKGWRNLHTETGRWWSASHRGTTVDQYGVLAV